jgi:hypothetical protein
MNGTSSGRNARPRRLARPQFSMRTMFLLVAILALCLGLVTWLGSWGIGISVVILIVTVVALTGAITWVEAVTICVVIVGLFAFLFPAVSAADPSMIYVARIAQAMRMYDQHHGCFPPAWLPDDNGEPMHSWRVLLLPYLGENALYAQYDFSEPWDGPNNQKLANSMPNVYAIRGSWGRSHSKTSFVVVTGEETLFPGSRSMRLDEIGDGAKQTILVVPWYKSDVPWLEPRDLRFDEMTFRVNDRSGKPGIRGHQIASLEKGAVVAFADGRPRLLTPDTEPQLVRSLLTANGGEDLSDFY